MNIKFWIRIKRSLYLCCSSLFLFQSSALNGQNASPGVFFAGAATSNITPKIGTSINGNFRDGKIQNIHDETHARSIVLDDGNTCLSFMVMDLCMVSWEILDKAKAWAHKESGIPVENMLMSAVHTHSGGTAVPVFQSEPDPAYVEFLSERAADALIRAYRNRKPARIGWGVGSGEVSADYYGMFADRIGELLGADRNRQGPPFVGIMSNGTSGDINNIHWAGQKSDPKAPYTHMRMVANTLAADAYKAILGIEYKDWVSLASFQKEISLGVRKPDKEEIERTEKIVSNAKGPVMMTTEEVYARETLFMKDYPDQVPVILQAFRIEDLAITAVPAEVFAEIGLEMKARSPFKPSFTIELANGYNGYLPTPAQNKLGGYETWRARSSYLEVGASPKITKVLFELLNNLESFTTQVK